MRKKKQSSTHFKTGIFRAWGLDSGCICDSFKDASVTALAAQVEGNKVLFDGSILTFQRLVNSYMNMALKATWMTYSVWKKPSFT